MKKIKLLGIACSLIVGMSSCTVLQSHSITGAPVGKKVGVSKGLFKTSISEAMKQGKINKIGSVDITVKVFILPYTKVVVTGE